MLFSNLNCLLSRRGLLACVVCASVWTAGCKALLTGLVMIHGTDTPPEFPILLKDEVSAVVVCRAVSSQGSQGDIAARQLISSITELIDANVRNKRFTIVPASAVEAWLDRHDNDESVRLMEVGKRGDTQADIVIAVELQGFRTRSAQSPQLYQGHAQLLVTATEVETGKVVARKNLRIVDPPDVPVPASSVTESVFQRSFTEVIAREVAALFHPHDPNKIRRIQADSLEMY